MIVYVHVCDVERLLNDVRFNTPSRETIERLYSLQRPLQITEGIEPTRLHSKNIDVNQINNRFLANLEGEEVLRKIIMPWHSRLMCIVACISG